MGLYFARPEHLEAWKAAAQAAKEAGLYDKAEEGCRSFVALSGYLDGYGKSSGARVVVTPAGPRAPMEFGLSFQWHKGAVDGFGGAWSEEMYGGAVFRPGEGWGVHT